MGNKKEKFFLKKNKIKREKYLKTVRSPSP